MNAEIALELEAINRSIETKKDIPKLKRLTDIHTYLGVHIKAMMDGVEF